MASLRLLPAALLSASLALGTACSVEEIHVKNGGPAPDPTPEADPLDTAPEGEPICTKEGWCWEFPYTPSSITSIHSSTPNALWAVGSGGTILRSHSRGEAWRPMPTGLEADLHGVFGVDLHTAWAVGAEGVLLAFDGKSWSRVPVPVESDAVLRGVWASGPKDAWVVGSEIDRKSEREVGIVLRWNGTSWTRLASSLPPLRAVHGKGSDVWVAGGSFETPRALRFDGTKFEDIETLGLAGHTSVYGPAIGVWVNGHDDVLVTAGEMNTSTIARFTGSWKIEQTQLYSFTPLGGFGRGLDGSPVVVGNPPLVSNGEGGWVPLSQQSYAGVTALWSVDEEVTVLGGRDGILGWSADEGARPSSLMTTNLEGGWAAGEDGVYRFDGAARRWNKVLAPSRTAGWSEYFIGAVQAAENDVLVTSALMPEDDPYSGTRPRYRFRRWDGKEWTAGELPEQGGFSSSTVAITRSGDMWIAQPGSGRPPVRRTRAGAETSLGKCEGSSVGTPYASFVWAAGDDVFFWASNGSYRVEPNGRCTFSPRPNESNSFVAAHALSPNDVWVVTKSNDASAPIFEVSRYDGASWTKMTTTSKEIRSVKVLEGGGVFLVGPSSLFTWNGSALVDVPTGLRSSDTIATLWGKSAAELRVVAGGGRILARKR
ncbi:MAG: hypothetical protein JST00_47835 [Deltaproteobacteria bacterium]|nr:hypothetical protein [Deltaproteobacteria bacterium]